jgi:hypothetical protein
VCPHLTSPKGLAYAHKLLKLNDSKAFEVRSEVPIVLLWRTDAQLVSHNQSIDFTRIEVGYRS